MFRSWTRISGACRPCPEINSMYRIHAPIDLLGCTGGELTQLSQEKKLTGPGRRAGKLDGRLTSRIARGCPRDRVALFWRRASPQVSEETLQRVLAVAAVKLNYTVDKKLHQPTWRFQALRVRSLLAELRRPSYAGMPASIINPFFCGRCSALGRSRAPAPSAAMTAGLVPARKSGNWHEDK